MGPGTRKQKRVCREIQEEFRARSDLSNLIDGQKTEISQICSVFRSEMSWPDEIRHQFWPVPELAKSGFEPHTRGITWRAHEHLLLLYTSSLLLLYSLGVSLHGIPVYSGSYRLQAPVMANKRLHRMLLAVVVVVVVVAIVVVVVVVAAAVVVCSSFLQYICANAPPLDAAADCQV